MGARYRIEPQAVEALAKGVDALARKDLTANSKEVDGAVNQAIGCLDGTSPIIARLEAFQLASRGQLTAVATQTGDVLTAAMNAVNDYVEADIAMARRGERGVHLTATSVSGLNGDRAQRRAAHETTNLDAVQHEHALEQRNAPSVPDWVAAVSRR